jgi:hypothetical protein
LTDNVQEVVVKNHDAVQEVLNECNRLLKELQTNRVPAERINSKQNICNRLDEAIRVVFPAAEEAHAAFLRALEDRRAADKTVTDNSLARQAELIEHLKYTQSLLGSISSLDQAAAAAKRLRDGLVEVKEIIKTLQDDLTDDIFFSLGSLELKADPVELQKGERMVLALDIKRINELDSRLVVEFKAPEKSNLTVPARVQVPRKATRFQIEIIAGNTAGDFVVQVIPRSPSGKPAMGEKDTFDKKPFEIKVKVK